MQCNVEANGALDNHALHMRTWILLLGWIRRAKSSATIKILRMTETQHPHYEGLRLCSINMSTLTLLMTTSMLLLTLTTTDALMMRGWRALLCCLKGGPTQ